MFFSFVIVPICVVLVCAALFSKLTCGIAKVNKCLVGKSAIITGGNSGIGFATALDFASRGCRVILADITDGSNVIEMISQITGNSNILYKYLDLGSFDSVRKFAADIVKTENQLDLLINNAGCGGHVKVFTEDGLKKTMQVNYFSHFLLTHLLKDLLISTPESRVVFVSSLLAFVHKIRKSQPEQLNSIDAGILIGSDYQNSKLCDIVAAKLLAKKLADKDVKVYSVHPGIVKSTIYKASYNNMNVNDIRISFFYYLINVCVKLYGKDTWEGAQTTIYCALSKDAENGSGKLFCDCKPFYYPQVVYNDEFCEKIWSTSEKMVKLKENEKI